MKNKLKILVVEDQQLSREGLKIILSGIPEVELIGECKDAKEFFDFIINSLPDIVLMDIKMPDINGLEAVSVAQTIYPDLKFIMLSSCNEEEYLLHALNLYVKGYLMKTADEKEIRKAILEVNKGRNYFSDELLAILSRSFMTRTKSINTKQSQEDSLTNRELEVLYLIVDMGYSNKKIAEKCSLKPSTVKGHRTKIFNKTGINNTPELISNAYKNHIIGQDCKFNFSKVQYFK